MITAKKIYATKNETAIFFTKTSPTSSRYKDTFGY